MFYSAHNSRSILADDQIRRMAPSVFADAAHESRSARYTHIPTIQVLDGLRKEGFFPVHAMQSASRDENKRGHAKHVIRLRHQGAEYRSVGDEHYEIVLVNSHDGSSSYQMMSGMYRMVCSNGLISPANGENEELRVHHKGDVIGRVIEGAYEVLGRIHEIEGQKDGMKSLTLNREEQELFAAAALTLKYDEEEHVPVAPTQLLRPRRSADRAEDLWTQFNVVQENLVRGGLRGRNAKGERTTTREVKSIDGNVKLNKALWMLADGMRKLKAA